MTNGIKVADDPTLLEHLDEVVFSLDSIDPALTDAVRGAGVHAAVTAAIEAARRLPHRPRLFINMVVMRANLGEIEPMLRYCEARGIGVNIQPAVFGLPYYDDAAKPLALDQEQTREMYRTLAHHKRQGRPLMFAAATYENAGRWSDYARAVAAQSPAARRASWGGCTCTSRPTATSIRACRAVAAVRPKNLIRDGFEAALTHVQRHECGDCYSAYLNERKALFGLRPAAVVEYLRRG